MRHSISPSTQEGEYEFCLASGRRGATIQSISPLLASQSKKLP